MNNPKDFESKIRETLDSHRVDYQESYWNKYNDTYPLQWYQKIRFSWKSHAIFAYSLLSFALGYLWNSGIFKKSPEKTATNITNTDTVFMVKEINHKDTVYVYQTRNLIYSDEGNLTAAPARFESHIQPNESKTRSTAIVNAAEINLNEVQSDPIEPNNPTFKALASSEINAIAEQNGKDFVAIDSGGIEEIGGIASRSTEIHSPAKDSNNTKEIVRLNSVNDFIEDSDSTEWEDPEIIKINQKRGYWEWGLGLSTLNFLPYEQGEVSYNWGIFGGIDLNARRDRWSIHASLLYGSNYIEIEEVADVDISVSHEFAGFKDLTITPEEVRMITQTLAPQFDIEYALLNRPKYGMGISAGVMGILPMERLFIYDYSWQSQVRTRESQPGMDPFKLMPSTGLSFWYQPSYDWQIELGANLYPTMIGSPIHEANAVSPVAIQLGVFKYW